MGRGMRSIPASTALASSSRACMSSSATSPHTLQLIPRCGMSASATKNSGPSGVLSADEAHHATDPRRTVAWGHSVATGPSVASAAAGVPAGPSVPRTKALPAGHRSDGPSPSSTAVEPHVAGVEAAPKMAQERPCAAAPPVACVHGSAPPPRTASTAVSSRARARDAPSSRMRTCKLSVECAKPITCNMRSASVRVASLRPAPDEWFAGAGIAVPVVHLADVPTEMGSCQISQWCLSQHSRCCLPHSLATPHHTHTLHPLAPAWSASASCRCLEHSAQHSAAVSVCRLLPHLTTLPCSSV
mmetsp:Transcript_7181/g.20838  ORF Transcript_7181/g.20838 Transcript_7181/m.20838 type:complete len:301 (-) Transcript_7181:875-1777(-)